MSEVTSGHDVVGLGEVMLRLAARPPQRLDQASELDVQIGGTEANVAAACARLGLRTALISVLPSDHAWGDRTIRELTGHGVDCRGVLRRPGQRMGLYFIEYGMAPRPVRILYDRRDSAFSRLEIGVGMSEAHANAAPRSFGNDFRRVLQFGSNSHHANAPARRLPEPLKQSHRRSQQIFRRMCASPRMADEWSFKMDTERESPNLAIRIMSFEISFALFDGIRQSFKGAQLQIHRSSDGSRKITRDPMPRQQLLDRRQRLGGIVHDVISGAAVNVKINVTRRDYATAEVGYGNSGGNLATTPSGNLDDVSVLDEHERMLDGASRRKQPSSSKGQHRNVLIAVRRRL